ncbi:hypothetical protein LVD17_14720 [Fulvivirga ulvae]|uniref:hypothetical protein n=1 Tax=Fulvivirga ulvae TaxID=2904245 RepID=UPI001F1B08F0|nr:hypothetical protein [Fulvivirga ulvae]UII35060.1 hypothetical protein LVD17_14720 [Fulvivirga ulvae]
MSHRKSSSSVILAVAIVTLSLLGCSSGSSSHTEATDSLNKEGQKADTLSISEEANDDTKTEPTSETLNLEMNDFEKSMIEAVEEGLYLVQTEQGFDYIKEDINKDGFDDAVALLTFESDPENYDFETTVMILVFQTLPKGTLIQSGGSSENLGGESIKYKDYKKLAWKNETITYTHQSMRNHMEVDIKIKDDFRGATVDKVSICYYNTSGCKDLFVASEQDAVDLLELNKEFLINIIRE